VTCHQWIIRDAELLAEAIDAGISGTKPVDTALAEYEQRRNDVSFALYEENWKSARLIDWDTEENIRLYGVLQEDPEEAAVILRRVAL